MQTHIQTYEVTLVDGVFLLIFDALSLSFRGSGEKRPVTDQAGEGGGDVPDKGPLFVHLTSPYAMFTIEYKFVRHRVIDASVCLAS